MKRRRKSHLGAILGLAGFGVLLVLERVRPLRRGAAGGGRVVRNLAVGASGALAVMALEDPVATALARWVARRRGGLVPRLGLPRPVETAVTLLLLDYTLYVWHVLTHKVPLLWRFHRVHHADEQLDVWTGLRFHLGEMALSVPWRAAQVAIIGVTPPVLSRWRSLLLGSVLFHHARLALPAPIDRALSYVVTTPRLHTIHHADREELRNTNWSSGLTLWDWLHGTLARDVPAEAVVIGLGGGHQDQAAPPSKKGIT
jgi:sterol desaturase/sphingolipid hydroxylase (fatty acid hydroxylase superfamily)